MKNQYEKIKIQIYMFQAEDIVTLSSSGEIDGDETKHPIPDGWVE